MSDAILITPRLILRHWRESDRVPFAELNADPVVMTYFRGCLTREESDAMIDRAIEHHARHGFGPFALELRSEQRFIGYIALAVPPFEAHFTPAVEIGWRLAAAYHGRGLATEGAQAMVEYAFSVLKLPEIVSFTVPHNVASRRVMEKIGMTHDEADDFEHPNLPAGHPLRHHVLYRLRPQPLL